MLPLAKIKGLSGHYRVPPTAARRLSVMLKADRKTADYNTASCAVDGRGVCGRGQI